jgi:PAS domain S-box-containing protein
MDLNGMLLIILSLVVALGITAFVAWYYYRLNSQLRKHNDELMQEKYLLDFMMDNLPISIYFKDRESRFIKVSRHMMQHFHTSHLDIIGKTDFDIQDQRHAREAYDDEQSIMRTFQSKINYLEREVHHDGLERWVSTTKMPLLNSAGQVIGTLGISKDISDVKRQNRELQQSEEKIRAQNIQLQEQQEELAAQYEELVQSQEEISAQRDIVAEQNERLKEASELIRKQSELVNLRNENLEVEIEKRTKDLVEYNQQLEQFAFITAHNLRAPVARILGLGNVLHLPNQKLEEKQPVLEMLLATAHDLDQVIRDLNIILEIKKNLTHTLTTVEFNKELEKVLSNLESEIKNTQATIRHDFTAAPCVISFLPYIDSILFNLLSNAIKYNHPTRPLLINIKSYREDNQVVLSIVDNGLGIDLKQYGAQLFNLYKRFHNHIEGKGMGLYLVKSQITTLGGKIHIESEPDRGTSIYIFFKEH